MEKQDIGNELSKLLINIKSLAKLGALASESCIIDNELQIAGNIEYYVLLDQIVLFTIEGLKLLE